MIPLSLFHIPLFPNTLVECEKEDGGFNQTDQYWKTLRRGMGKIKGAVLVTYPEMTIEVIRIPNYHIIFFRHCWSRIICDQKGIIKNLASFESKQINSANQNLKTLALAKKLTSLIKIGKNTDLLIEYWPKK